MFAKVKDFAKKYKIRIGLVGGAVVLSTAFGTCALTPSEEAPAPVEAPAPAEEAKEEAPEQAPAEEPKEEAPEEKPAE